MFQTPVLEFSRNPEFLACFDYLSSKKHKIDYQLFIQCISVEDIFNQPCHCQVVIMFLVTFILFYFIFQYKWIGRLKQYKIRVNRPHDWVAWENVVVMRSMPLQLRNTHKNMIWELFNWWYIFYFLFPIITFHLWFIVQLDLKGRIEKYAQSLCEYLLLCPLITYRQ